MQWKVEDVKIDGMIAIGTKIVTGWNFLGIGNLAKTVNFSR